MIADDELALQMESQMNNEDVEDEQQKLSYEPPTEYLEHKTCFHQNKYLIYIYICAPVR
jgi:hypothetical protein